MIQVENLRKQYDNVMAVDDLSFQLEEGQTLVLAGTSGSGKTTTLKMINRLIEPTGGRILINDENILDQEAAAMRRRIGYVIQHIGLFPHYTIAQNIAVVPQLLGWDAGRIRERSEELLERLGLPPSEFMDRYPHELSGGQQQRVGIARALAANPPLILMDEPFGALDPITRQQLRADFQQLETLRSKTTLIVTHDVEEAFIMGDLICLLDEGKVQQLGTPQELLFEPANEFVRQFIGEQRLQLTYQALDLEAIREQLPQHPEAEPDLSFGPEEILAQVQNRLLEHPDPNASGRISGTPTLFRLTDLLAACEQRLKN